jgi:SAM-dependent methyltransferase
MIPLPRHIQPEWLDSLDPDDPRAVRARRDLRLINFLMGNEGWICRQVAARAKTAEKGLVELGSGDGRLLAKLAKHGPATGCDRAPRPPDLPQKIDWREGDLFSLAEPLSGGILVANLVLHHFSAEELLRIGTIAGRFDSLLFVEPHRSRRALVLARLLSPLVGGVTRHDMPVSIHAGFAVGELGKALGLSADWSATEVSHWCGSLRFAARRLA